MADKVAVKPLRMMNSVVNFSYFATKNRLRKPECKGATFQGRKQNLYNLFPTEKVAPLHLQNLATYREVFPQLLIFLLLWKQHLALSREFVCGT